MPRRSSIAPENAARNDASPAPAWDKKKSLPDWALSRLVSFDYPDALRAEVTQELLRFWPQLDVEIFTKVPRPAIEPLFDSLAFAVRMRLTKRVAHLRSVKRESDALAQKIQKNLSELAALLRQEQQLHREYDVAPWVSDLHEALDGVSQESRFRAHRSVTGLDRTLGIWANTSQPGPTLVDLVEFIAADRERSAGQSILPWDFPPNLAPRAIPLLDLFDDFFAGCLNSAHVSRPRLSHPQRATLYSAVTGGDYAVRAAKERAKRIRKSTDEDRDGNV